MVGGGGRHRHQLQKVGIMVSVRQGVHNCSFTGIVELLLAAHEGIVPITVTKATAMEELAHMQHIGLKLIGIVVVVVIVVKWLFHSVCLDGGCVLHRGCYYCRGSDAMDVDSWCQLALMLPLHIHGAYNARSIERVLGCSV